MFSSSRLKHSEIVAVFPSIIGGINFATLSPLEKGSPKTLAASLIACLALIVAKVTIWATLSWPYFSIAYWITSFLYLSSKSISISGRDFLPLLRNRSKINPYSSGSIPVIPKQYETIDPAAEPLPAPVLIFLFLENSIKSPTIKKYEENPIEFMTSNS